MDMPLNIILYVCIASFALGALLFILVVMLIETKKDFFGGRISASKLMPKCKPPKTDFNEMCGSCFSSMISKMPLRTICDLKEVERQRMIGCSHRTKAATPPPTTEYLGGNEPDFGVTPLEVDTRRTTG